MRGPRASPAKRVAWGRGGARERAQFSPPGGNEAKRTLRRRGGCWFCPNAKRRELRHLYDHHPDLWGRMLELQAIPGKATEKFNRTQTFADIHRLFRQEDEDAAQAAA